MEARAPLFRSAAFNLQLIAGSCLGGGKTRGQYTEWGTGHIVHANLVAELDRRGIAAVFAANSYLQIGAGFSSAFDSDLNQFSHSVAIDHGEGILFEDAFG
jgi:hypothetical protein